MEWAHGHCGSAGPLDLCDLGREVDQVRLVSDKVDVVSCIGHVQTVYRPTISVTGASDEPPAAEARESGTYRGKRSVR